MTLQLTDSGDRSNRASGQDRAQKRYAGGLKCTHKGHRGEEAAFIVLMSLDSPTIRSIRTQNKKDALAYHHVKLA